MAEKLPEKLDLEIVAPTRQVFAGAVQEVTVPGREGYLGILPGHAPLLSELKPGLVSFVEDGVRTVLYSGWGFVEVLPDRVSVLVEEAEFPDEVDVEAAMAARSEAEAAFHSHSSELDYAEVMERWEAAVARLQVAGVAPVS